MKLPNEKWLRDAVEQAPIPKLRTSYQRQAFAVSLASILGEHKDEEVRLLGLIIGTILAAPAPRRQAMLEAELSIYPLLKLRALEAEGKGPKPPSAWGQGESQ